MATLAPPPPQASAGRPRLASNILLWTIVAFVAIFVGWAALTELDRTVRGLGRVVPASQLQTVSNFEGGIVERILVSPGQLVKAGDPLLLLDQTQTGAELGSGRVAVDALNIKIARLSAEVRGAAPRYPAARDPAAAEQIRVERALHAARLAQVGSMGSAAASRVTQAQRAVNAADASYTARQQALSAARSEVALLRPLVTRGIEPRLSLMQAESQAAIAASEAAAASAEAARARSAVAEAQASLFQANQQMRSEAATELAAAQAELAGRRRALPALTERVSRTTVRAPLAGRVNRLLATTVGGSVAPGAPLIEIVPSDRNLIIEAMVDPKDIAFVRIDQPAKIDVTAYDSAIYGSLDGKVVTISPDSVLDERTGETHYVVRVAASEMLKDQGGRPLPIGPGMVANVSLLGDKRTILDYILSPITKLSDRALRE